MRYKTKLLIYILCLNALLIGVTLLLYSSNKLLFFVLEFVFIVSLVLGFKIYSLFSRPFDLLSSGIESLKDQDFSMQLKPVRSKEFNLLVNVYNKMIHQLRKDRIALSEKNFLLTLLMDASPSGILIFDVDDRLVSLNNSAEKFITHSIENIKGMKLDEISQMSKGIFDRANDSKNYIFKKDGTQTYRIQIGFFIDRGCNTRFILIEDLSHEIIKTEKLSYEKVIRMMSHEVNNTVGAVNSILNTIQPKLSEWEHHQKAVDVCISRNDNMNRFMRNFADVVRIPSPELRSMDLNMLVSNTILLVQSRIDTRDIEIDFSPSQQHIDIRGDSSQLEQALINIIKNSIEAVENEGIIKIITSTVPTTLRVIDNGVGIHDSEREKLFTPFYTNKAKGQGIGLTIIREILTNHNCSFNLDSNNGSTEFVIHFPE